MAKRKTRSKPRRGSAETYAAKLAAGALVLSTLISGVFGNLNRAADPVPQPPQGIEVTCREEYTFVSDLARDNPEALDELANGDVVLPHADGCTSIQDLANELMTSDDLPALDQADAEIDGQGE